MQKLFTLPCSIMQFLGLNLLSFQIVLWYTCSIILSILKQCKPHVTKGRDHVPTVYYYRQFRARSGNALYHQRQGGDFFVRLGEQPFSRGLRMEREDHMVPGDLLVQAVRNG